MAPVGVAPSPARATIFAGLAHRALAELRLTMAGGPAEAHGAPAPSLASHSSPRFPAESAPCPVSLIRVNVSRQSRDVQRRKDRRRTVGRIGNTTRQHLPSSLY